MFDNFWTQTAIVGMPAEPPTQQLTFKIGGFFLHVSWSMQTSSQSSEFTQADKIAVPSSKSTKKSWKNYEKTFEFIFSYFSNNLVFENDLKKVWNIIKLKNKRWNCKHERLDKARKKPRNPEKIYFKFLNFFQLFFKYFCFWI